MTSMVFSFKCWVGLIHSPSDIRFGCSSIWSTDSNECRIWWPCYHMGCEYYEKFQTYFSIFVMSFNKVNDWVFVDLGRAFYPFLPDGRFSPCWWKIFTVNVYPKLVSVLQYINCVSWFLWNLYGCFCRDGTSIVISDEVGQIYLLATGEGRSQKDAKYDQVYGCCI